MDTALLRAINKAREITNYKLKEQHMFTDTLIQYHVMDGSTPTFFRINRSAPAEGQIDPQYAIFQKYDSKYKFEPIQIDWRNAQNLIDTIVGLWCKCCDAKGLSYKLQSSYTLKDIPITVTASYKLQDDKFVTNWQIVEKRLDDLLHALNL